MEYHVAVGGDDAAQGTRKSPFRTITKAAEIAVAGDHIIVHEGEYREWVKPVNGGRSNSERIVYEAAEGEKVVIKGSERITGWKHMEGSVWKVMIPNDFFGNFNPYEEVLQGDWLLYPKEYKLHLGDVYLNGRSFYEAVSVEALRNPVQRIMGIHPSWTKHEEKLLRPEDSVYQWHAEVDSKNTTIYANFQEYDPNKELVEISVRKCCFYPEETERNYITVRGFELCQAACPWAPPTAEQFGIIGTNWSKGWIIENNHIHDAKCSAVSIGKGKIGGDNLSLKTWRKSGHQYQLEAIFQAYHRGWQKERIGSHIIRNNVIYDCGQNAIVGHMGSAFCKIKDNHISNIGVKYEFYGYEIAGIKLHAAIDTEIEHNCIHNCTLGTWLDWEAQGTRVSRNLYYKNARDLMVEVTHGPYIVDNNIFGSEYNFDNISQGGAYIHNLCMGTMRRVEDLTRFTPYHFPHSTDIAGVACIESGDDRIIQNIFSGEAPIYTEESKNGTVGYQGHTVSMEEYIEKTKDFESGHAENSERPKQPVYIQGNIYLNGAEAFEREESNYISEEKQKLQIAEEDGKVYLLIWIDAAMERMKTKIYTSEDLGSPRISEAAYENADGSEILFDRDFFGKSRGKCPTAGPIEGLKRGENKILLWEP